MCDEQNFNSFAKRVELWGSPLKVLGQNSCGCCFLLLLWSSSCGVQVGDEIYNVDFFKYFEIKLNSKAEESCKRDTNPITVQI